MISSRCGKTPMRYMQHLLQKRCRATSRYRSARPPKNAHQEEPKGLPTQASPLTHSGLKTDINAIVEPNAPSVTSTSVRSVISIEANPKRESSENARQNIHRAS